jgi:hypothetical protein
MPVRRSKNIISSPCRMVKLYHRTDQRASKIAGNLRKGNFRIGQLIYKLVRKSQKEGNCCATMKPQQKKQNKINGGKNHEICM